jgi:hypothetical protein
MTGWTKGPWRTSLVASATSLPIYTDAEQPVLIGCTSSAGRQDMNANARLISAAPEMAEALAKISAEAWLSDDPRQTILDICGAALKKAKGE